MQTTTKTPTLTPTMQAEIQALNNRPIDLSEDKEITDWQGAVRGMFKFAKEKPQIDNTTMPTITEYFDKDVIELLIKHNTPQDHKRINGVLRSMLATV